MEDLVMVNVSADIDEVRDVILADATLTHGIGQ